MAFTREFIRNAAKESGVELPKEFENALIDEHISTRDAFAAEQVNADREKNKPEPAPAVKDTPEYKKLKKDFDDYKADQAAKETHRAKLKAFRAILKDVNISEKRMDTVVKAAQADGVIDALELDEKGVVKDPDSLRSSIKEDWSDFVVTVTTEGAQIAHPPVNTGGAVNPTVAEIRSMKDPEARKLAIAKNLDLYGVPRKES